MIRDTFYDYISSIKRYSPHTLKAYKTDLLQFQDYCQDIYNINSDTEVTYSIVRSWLASLVDAGMSSRSINRKLSSLKVYYRYLQKEGLISENPLLRAASLTIPQRLPVFATRSEMESALSGENSGPGFAERRDMLVVEIFYCTGLRLSELINLKISDIDTSALTLKVTGKGNKQRIIPVIPGLMKLIDEYIAVRSEVAQPGVRELIVTNSGKKSYPVFIYRIVTAILKGAGVKGRKSPHILRHTFASHLLNEGADLFAIKELLGHSSLAATQVYTHISIEKLKSIYKHAHPRA